MHEQKSFFILHYKPYKENNSKPLLFKMVMNCNSFDSVILLYYT